MNTQNTFFLYLDARKACLLIALIRVCCFTSLYPMDPEQAAFEQELATLFCTSQTPQDQLDYESDLHELVEQDNTQALRAILDHAQHPEALVNAPDKHGRTPLAIAVLCEHAEAAHILLEHGANPDAHNPGFLQTPRQIAAECAKYPNNPACTLVFNWKTVQTSHPHNILHKPS